MQQQQQPAAEGNPSTEVMTTSQQQRAQDKWINTTIDCDQSVVTQLSELTDPRGETTGRCPSVPKFRKNSPAMSRAALRAADVPVPAPASSPRAQSPRGLFGRRAKSPFLRNSPPLSHKTHSSKSLHNHQEQTTLSPKRESVVTKFLFRRGQSFKGNAFSSAAAVEPISHDNDQDENNSLVANHNDQPSEEEPSSHLLMVEATSSSTPAHEEEEQQQQQRDDEPMSPTLSSYHTARDNVVIVAAAHFAMATAAQDAPQPQTEQQSNGWSCEYCTFLNCRSDYLTCEVCGLVRSSGVSSSNSSSSNSSSANSSEQPAVPLETLVDDGIVIVNDDDNNVEQYQQYQQDLEQQRQDEWERYLIQQRLEEIVRLQQQLALQHEPEWQLHSVRLASPACSAC